MSEQQSEQQTVTFDAYGYECPECLHGSGLVPMDDPYPEDLVLARSASGKAQFLVSPCSGDFYCTRPCERCNGNGRLMYHNENLCGLCGHELSEGLHLTESKIHIGCAMELLISEKGLQR